MKHLPDFKMMAKQMMEDLDTNGFSARSDQEIIEMYLEQAYTIGADTDWWRTREESDEQIR